MSHNIPIISLNKSSSIGIVTMREGHIYSTVTYTKHGDSVTYFHSFGDLSACKLMYNNQYQQKVNTVGCGHLCLKFISQ